MKTCTCCQTDLDDKDFPTTGKNYLSGRCRVCVAEYKKKWKNQNRKRVAEQNRKWRELNIPKKVRKLKTVEQKRESQKLWREANKEKIRAKSRERYVEWKAKNTQRLRKYYNDKYHSNPQYQLRLRLRTRIRLLLKKQGAVRSTNSSVQLLGCDLKMAVSHIESQFHPNLAQIQMSWSNSDLWEIDHINPLHKFDLTCPEQQLIAFNYKNLQPLWKDEHKDKTYNDVFR